MRSQLNCLRIGGEPIFSLSRFKDASVCEITRILNELKNIYNTVLECEESNRTSHVLLPCMLRNVLRRKGEFEYRVFSDISWKTYIFLEVLWAEG